VRPVGRPRLGRDKRVRSLKVALSHEEAEQLQRWAARIGRPSSTLMREVALDAAATSTVAGPCPSAPVGRWKPVVIGTLMDDGSVECGIEAWPALAREMVKP